MWLSGANIEQLLASGSLLAYPAVFAGGLLASMTPCAYPLIPVTVSFLGSRETGSRLKGFLLSLAYVTGIAGTYAALGIFAALTGRMFGSVTASPLTPFLAGNLLIAMALAQFDLYELRLPSWLRGGAATRPTGLAGAFGVGLAAGFLVGPCIAPVFGALLLFIASRQNVLFGGTLMFTFALGMGTLLVVIGTATSLAARLPRSGRWLLTVKRGFGVLMFLTGEYFLVQAGRLLG